MMAELALGISLLSLVVAGFSVLWAVHIGRREARWRRDDQRADAMANAVTVQHGGRRNMFTKPFDKL